MGAVCSNCGEGVNKMARLNTGTSAPRVMSTESLGARKKSMVFLADNTGRHPKELYKIDDRKPIGTGAFGSVRLGKNIETNQTVAIKQIQKKKTSRDIIVLQNEIDLNKTMDHPNIARLYETFEDAEYIYIAMELCAGGEMFDLILEQGHFREAEAAFLMQQIFRAVYYMHNNQIAHRDLKPENFLLTKKKVPVGKNTLKVIDFGIAKRYDPAQANPLKTKAGTAYYLAPEVLAGRYNEKCDVWSCGVILYILLCGSPPFAGDTDKDIIEAVKKGRIDFNYDEFRQVSSEVKTLIQNCCQMDVGRRWDSYKASNHPWLKKVPVDAPSLSREESRTSESLLNKFKKFSSANRFQKAARHIIAHHLDHDQLKLLQEQFCSMDEDNNGELTLEELKAGCKKLGITNNEEISELFETIDVDHSGSISYSEFLAATMESKHFMRRELYWEAFRVFDLDHNGRIAKAEFEKIMETDGSSMNLPGVGNAAEIAAMFAEADADGDGEIDFQEFVAMMEK